MNLFLIVVSFLLLFSFDVHSRPVDDLSLVPSEDWCSAVVEGLQKILVSPALQLTVDQLALIPARRIRRQRLSLCPAESRQWLEGLEVLAATLTDAQLRTLQQQINRLVQQLSEDWVAFE